MRIGRFVDRARYLVARLVLPPAAEPWPSPDRIRVYFWIHLVGCILANVGNIQIYLSLREEASVNREVLDVFVFTNVVALGVDLLLTLLFLRRWSRAYPWVTALSGLIVVGTCVVWSQMTGSVQGWFFSVALGTAVTYRLAYTYWVGVVVFVEVVVGYILIYTLEQNGVLRPVSLFAGDPGALFSSQALREAGLLSVLNTALVTWVGVNHWVYVLRDARAAVVIAQSNLRRAADQARLGRLSGTRLGTYLVEDLLGRGGMGEVYAAKRQQDGSEVAIKLLHAHLGTDQEMRARFRREAEVVRKMPAGTVAAVYEFGTNEDGYDYIVMEKLRGEDLGALLRRRERLELHEVIAIVDGLAVGLDAAHALGVVHRDLKPQNVFLGGEPGTGAPPDVRLLDFGVARLHEAAAAQQMTATAAVIGTPGYMPPEQVGAGTVGPPADIFALGAIVYRMVTGKAAFPSRSPAGALFEALNYDPPPLSEVVAGLPADLDSVLTLALAKDPSLRYQRASELARDLGAAVRGELPDDVRARAAKLTRAAIGSAATMTATAG